MERKYEFKFFDGTTVVGSGTSERDALRRLGLGAYNPVAYTVRDVTEPSNAE